MNAGKTNVFSSCVPVQEKAPPDIEGYELEIKTAKNTSARVCCRIARVKMTLFPESMLLLGFSQGLESACTCDATFLSPRKFASGLSYTVAVNAGLYVWKMSENPGI
uniref:Uncharacterized protein n=1 Tax=Schistocephalus solidus TaxID=70667 RepID=A0A0X3Q2B8_SCHSO